MGRSLKKGPFVNAKLLKNIDELNAANEKKVLKTCQGHQLYSHSSWDIQSRYTTEKSTVPVYITETW